MEDKQGLTKDVEEIKKALNIGKENGKVKKLRFPARAKVKRGRLKKGWIGCMKVGENQSATFEKVQVEGGAFKTSDGSYHSTDGREILFFQGKFPFIVQEEKSINPKNFKFNELSEDVPQTYGDKNILAMMLRDTIKVKKGGNMSPIIIGIVIIGILYVLGKYVFKLF